MGDQARPSRLSGPGPPRRPEPIPMHAGQGRLAQTDLPPRRAARGDPAGAPAPADTAMARALRGVRAGIEGCLSQAMRLCGLRRSRYVGLAKAHLQHVASAAALNVVRLN